MTPRLLFSAMLLGLAVPLASAAPPSNNEPGTPQQEAPISPPDANQGTLNTSGTSTPTAPQALGNECRTGFMNVEHLTGDWEGLRETLGTDGLTFCPTYIGEVFGNPSGGAARGVIYDGLLNLPLDLDLEKMSSGDVTDLTLHVNALYLHGAGLSAGFVGDFSNTSNIAGYNTLRLDELWVQKGFWDKKFSLKVGNLAVDSEFFQSASSSLFINGTFGAFTFIANNVPDSPVYPLASPGVRLQFVPSPQWYVMAGVFGSDIDADPAINNRNGTRFSLNGDSGMLVMTEIGYLLNQQPNDHGLQGTYRLGSFVHTLNYPTFAGGSGGTNYGVYGVLDQQVYGQGDASISFFVRSGGAPTNTNFIDYYVDAGFNFAGFVPGRASDVAGLAVARSHVSGDFSDAAVAAGGLPSSAETVLEATYKVQLAPWWSVQPDFQYIITPSGVEGSSNATVLGVRTTVAF